MQRITTLKICLSTLALCVTAVGQNTLTGEIKGLPYRASPSEYQAQAKAGAFTIAAEFTGHAVPTLQKLFENEDYVVVEVAVFGAPDAHLTLTADDFSLRVNGKKAPTPSQAFTLAAAGLKDPEWIAPDAEDRKDKGSKGGVSTGGGGGADSEPPPPPAKMPLELRRAMNQQVQKAALPEGDRALPIAGLVFFPYRGKVNGIKTIELLYSGPAGKATLTLQP